MKKFKTIVLLALFLISSSTAFAGPKIKAQITENTIQTLIVGLESGNIGLKSSSAYMIGELQITEGIIPLLRVLHDEKNEDLRIAAALALYKIGSPTSIYAVKQAIRFDESKRVSKHCADFYQEYQKNKFNDEENIVDVSKIASK
jgi:hypothetical protein